jgi:hypothetical protein
MPMPGPAIFVEVDYDLSMMFIVSLLDGKGQRELPQQHGGTSLDDLADELYNNGALTVD